MLPNNTLSSEPIRSSFTEQQNRRTLPLIDYEMGGVAVNDASGGLLYRLWQAELVGDTVMLSSEGIAAVPLFTRSGITQIGLAFDQNMRPFVCFVQNGQARYWWFDTEAGAPVFTDLPVDAVTPRAAIDEKRAVYINNSDIILAYMRGTNLCYRQQRDRFLTERILASDVHGTLTAIGMNKVGRFQFRLLPTP